MTPARVLIIDDSVVIRRLLTDVLSADPDVEVVGTASNGRIGLERIQQFAPDLVTLDIEMPDMDGLATLTELRRSHPKLPVIMFSTLTERGAASTIEALARGANDYVTKPANVGSTHAAIAQVKGDLLPRVKALTGRDRIAEPATPIETRRSTRAALRRRPVSLVAIGSSTGGPNALEAVFSSFAALPVPLVVVQHMPPTFTRLLAQRLDQKSVLHVCEAQGGEPLEPGCAYLAPGGRHMVVRSDRAGGHVLELNDDAPENFCRPAVDVLFRSVAETHGAEALGVVLTGMGQDGLVGSRALVDTGADVLAQDQATSVVWGMPGYVARAGLATDVLPLDEVGPTIERRVTATLAGSTAGRGRQ